jgi:Methyltransferase FkbM domain
MLLHLAGSLKRSHVQFRQIKTYDVEIRTLDEAGLADVLFVKADVEGGEREVLEGARATIARDRPIIMLELLSGTHENPAADVAAICESFGYEAVHRPARRKDRGVAGDLRSWQEYELGERNRVAQCSILTTMRVAHRFASTSRRMRSRPSLAPTRWLAT